MKEDILKKVNASTDPNNVLEISIKGHLRNQLSHFRRGWLSESGWKTLLHDKDECNLYSNMAIFDLRNKCKYLAKAIESTLAMYDSCTFTQCCQHAVDTISNFERTDELNFEENDSYNKRWMITAPKTIVKWYNWYNSPIPSGIATLIFVSI